MKNKRKRGRPSGSRNVRVTPEFRKEPDIEKLGRALIIVALKIAEQKMSEEVSSVADGEGDAVA